MERLKFEVRGSQPDPYLVRFEANGGDVRAYCTCQAGQNGDCCKHRLALMNGDVTNLVSPNTADVHRLKCLLLGTPLEASYGRVQEAEAAFVDAQKELKAAKKALSKVMYG